ncbi:TmcC family electron transfer complex membrane anchor subunit [Desulfohalobium retbaense]|uniref:Nitrate reductase gamma subunit n=1 Tax=Desulfohalobium retbaense (strain ATCC 49708 / DSM 5692 / JCM 16813 / HR100) TaxID=485915 RepID=C8X1Z4_DESRD|nr:hypothetical protein [Desulfohalobium retbaense]ACV68317.1 conserved hypothetical protein [Desulfohalobium retbaense DSM 5692]
MNTLYSFVAGPLAWAAWIIFLVGIVYKIYHYVSLAKQRDAMVFAHMSGYYGLRSIGKWIVPYVATNWRKNAVLTAVTFLFHICLLLAPIFLFAHMLLWKEAIGLSFPTLPDTVADVMTLIVIGCCIYFLVRRLTVPEVKYVTQISDWLLLAVVAAPFVTGFLAYHQVLNYNLFIILHIIAGEIMLVTIPFTRLFHMILGLVSRAYAGSEFGAVRHARDW